jgi:hypothetical protein
MPGTAASIASGEGRSVPREENGGVTFSIAASGEELQPQCRVRRIVAADDRKAELGEGDERASHRLGAQRSLVEVTSFDQEVRSSRCAPQATDLKPQPPIDDRSMKIAHTLPLDDRVTRFVIADGESSQLRRHPELFQGPSHPTLALANVHDNAQLHDESLRP